ncbi:MAG: hypothetical protein LC722_03650, partial [Actinobacteria bacterium]|nr:hypothetical protein [Actinomycetota bacterium]
MNRVLSLLKVRPGEEPLVARFLAFNVVLWTTTAIGGNAVESLLLARVGAGALPTMYLLLAAATVVLMTVAGRVSRLDPRRAVPAVYLGIAAAAAALRPLLALDTPGGYRAAWLAMMVLWSFAGLSGWTLAGAVHDTRQAKRLFPLYGAGLVVGLVIGGFLTGPLAGA